jgi:peptidoglycan L-alanyl-D-glutamate endopeptidase CwlK
MNRHLGLHRLDGLAPEFRPRVDELLTALAAKGCFVLVVSGRRTIAEQNKIYAQGRTAPGAIVTNAKGGSSPHNFGHAVDLCPLTAKGEADWNSSAGFKIIGDTAEDLGLIWGGHFKSIKDLPHVESTGWRTVQAKWRSGEIEVA